MGRNLDKRRTPRVEIAHFVVGLPVGQRTVKGNISMGGVGFAVVDSDMVEPGDSITVHLEIPEEWEPLVLSAVVCHTGQTETNGQYIGARFVDMDMLVQHPLDRYLEEVRLLHCTPAGQSFALSA